MAEWLMRGTVNTFFRGSIPLDTSSIKKFFLFLKFYNNNIKKIVFLFETIRKVDTVVLI